MAKEESALDRFVRTFRSLMLPRAQPPLSDEEQEERKDARARLRAELDQMKAKHAKRTKPPD